MKRVNGGSPAQRPPAPTQRIRPLAGPSSGVADLRNRLLNDSSKS